jgi:hypothetical protein
VQPKDHQPLKAVSVYSPAWAVGRERLKEVDVSQVKTKVNPDVWVTDILWAALQNTVSGNNTWVVGGDCNSWETFDIDWHKRNKRMFSIRSSGNAESLRGQLVNTLSGSAVITVVQASESWPRNEAATRNVWSSATGRLLANSEMGSILVIVGNIVWEASLQMSLVQCNHVIEQLTPTASNPALTRDTHVGETIAN